VRVRGSGAILDSNVVRTPALQGAADFTLAGRDVEIYILQFLFGAIAVCVLYVWRMHLVESQYISNTTLEKKNNAFRPFLYIMTNGEFM
jgi:hypothetical protein